MAFFMETIGISVMVSILLFVISAGSFLTYIVIHGAACCEMQHCCTFEGSSSRNKTVHVHFFPKVGLNEL